MSVLDGNKQQFQTTWGSEALHSTVRGRHWGSARTKCCVFFLWGISLLPHGQQGEQRLKSGMRHLGVWRLAIVVRVALLSKRRTCGAGKAEHKMCQVWAMRCLLQGMLMFHVNTRGSTGGTWLIQCQVVIYSAHANDVLKLFVWTNEFLNTEIYCHRIHFWGAQWRPCHHIMFKMTYADPWKFCYE